MHSYAIPANIELYTIKKGTRDSLVSDIPAGDEKMANLFLQCTYFWSLDILTVTVCTCLPAGPELLCMDSPRSLTTSITAWKSDL
jgi:hypothetical protein